MRVSEIIPFKLLRVSSSFSLDRGSQGAWLWSRAFHVPHGTLAITIWLAKYKPAASDLQDFSLRSNLPSRACP